MTWVSVLCAAAAVALVFPPLTPPSLRARRAPALGGARARPAAVVGVGVGGWLVVGGLLGFVAGIVAGIAAHHLLATAESSASRHDREEVERTLPHLVELFASTLRAGAEPVAALARVCHAVLGPAADRLLPVVERSRWGAGGVEAWSAVADDDVVAPLSRTMVRSYVSGASVVRAVERLADELERESLARAEDAARRVGVAAALPLGVCMLPAFMLLGVVPTVADLFGSLTP